MIYFGSIPKTNGKIICNCQTAKDLIITVWSFWISSISDIDIVDSLEKAVLNLINFFRAVVLNTVCTVCMLESPESFNNRPGTIPRESDLFDPV